MFKSIVFIIFCLAMSVGIPSFTFAQSTQKHTVATGETLYGIARNYQIHISELLKANPQIQDNAIKPGDIVNIPATTKGAAPAVTPAKAVPATNPAQNVTQSNPFGGVTGSTNPQPAIPATNTSTTNTPAITTNVTAPSVKNNQFAMVEHVVQEKQTLYAISKLYNVSVDDIKAWNHLADNAIKVGSTILIRSQKPGESLAVSTPAPVAKTEVAVTPIPVPKAEVKAETVKPAVTETKTTPVLPAPVKEAPATSNKGLQGQLEDAYVSAKSSGKSLQSSRGTITWIATENAKMSDSYFALHKTAPVGTVIRVTNLVNKRVIFVKVIGKLPDTSDNLNITLRLSSAAKNALLLNGEKAYVDMEFYQ